MPFGGSVVQGYFPNGLVRLNALVAQPRAARAAPNGTAIPLPSHLANFPVHGGAPLDARVRQRMEAAFGTSFADVRVHVGPHAAAIGAAAVTQGTHLHFAHGQYQPQTPYGARMLAHELTHVVQQRGARVRNPFGSGVALVHDPRTEAEAERMAIRVATMRPPAVQRKAPIQRKPVPYRARTIQRTQAEANALRQLGQAWHGHVWIGADNTQRDAQLQNLNTITASTGFSFGKGFQQYDPVVRHGRAAPYTAIMHDAQAQADNGVAWAQTFYNWMTDNVTTFAALPARLQELALITHWAEVGRGYAAALDDLANLMLDIANGNATWAQLVARYDPALKYADDTKKDFQPRDDSDSDDDEPPSKISKSEMSNLGATVGTRTRSGKV